MSSPASAEDSPLVHIAAPVCRVHSRCWTCGSGTRGLNSQHPRMAPIRSGFLPQSSPSADIAACLICHFCWYWLLSSGVWSDILVLVRGVEDLGRHGVWTKIAERPYLRYICSSLQQWGIGDTCEDGSSKWYSMQVLKMLRKKTEYEIKTSLSSFLLLLYCMSPNPSTLALQQS